MLGRQPRLPIDLVLGPHKNQGHASSYSNYVDDLRKLLESAYNTALKHTQARVVKRKYLIRRSEVLPWGLGVES